MIKEIFDSQGNFPQSRKFCAKYLIKEILHKIFDQGNFPQSKFFHKRFDQRNIPLIKKFFNKRRFSANKKTQEGSLKATILDPLNTKFYAKIFLTL